ncbi:MAG TPA: hypothetical protein VGY75_08585 [Candidatus Udaeobacter sp.]|nr:hypothetical protein [Candidatus Udaeobacter sp.]
MNPCNALTIQRITSPRSGFVIRASEFRHLVNIHLTGWLVRATLRGVFHSRYVENLQYYGIKSYARQRHSPAWLG